MLNSLLKLRPDYHAGSAQNMRFTRSMFTAHLPQMEALLETYFKNGGTQAMITVLDRGDLERAMVEPEKYLLFIIHPDMMPELSSVFSKQTPKSALVKGAADDESLISLLRLLANTDAPSPYRDVTRRGLLSAFFGRLLDKIELIEPRAEDSHAIREVVNFCSEHFTRDLSLEMLEEELHLSRYYISHLFGHKLNIRFNDYVNSLRVSEACRLLRATSMGITDISAQVGFNTLRTFNRSFAKQMGQSPSEYRRKLSAATK
jgi:AraC-like DNA-binding protein